jgi:hypothetical protein
MVATRSCQSGIQNDIASDFGRKSHMANINLNDPCLLNGSYSPTAVYFMDSDCVEYVKEDAFCTYDRVDTFLTLIRDETGYNLIGFKLKGFKHVFEQYLKPLFELHDMQFVELVSAIEMVFTNVGDKVFDSKDERRAAAYKAALKLANNDNVRLSGAFLKAA